MSEPVESGNGVASSFRLGGFLSAEESAKHAIPFRSWSEEQVARVRSAAGGALAAWRAAWGIAPAPLGPQRVECARASEAPQGASDGWRSVPGTGGVWLQFSGRARGLAEFQLGLSDLSLELAGTAEESPVADDLVRAAWRDLEQRVASGLALNPGTGEGQVRPGGGTWSRWSGALIVSVPWWSAQLRLLLSGESVEQIVFPSGRPTAPKAPPRAVVPLTQALSPRAVRVEVQLEAFEIDIGALASMRVGDVVRTTHRIEHALVVEVGEAGTRSPVEWKGFLGHAGSNKAVELVGESRGKP